MTGILAIDAATDVCSVAVYRDGDFRQLYELAPRRHSQRLFTMLRELLPSGNLRQHGIEAIAYSCGPGSFTGLRIAASVAQGLAYTNGLPAVAVSTLACQAQTALRLGVVREDEIVLSMLDARIREVYYAVFSFTQQLAVLREGPSVCAPAAIATRPEFGLMHAVGSGCDFIEDMSPAVRTRVSVTTAGVDPAARDLIPLALDKFMRGEVQQPQQVQPMYVRNEISWKKLADQGRPQ